MTAVTGAVTVGGVVYPVSAPLTLPGPALLGIPTTAGTHAPVFVATDSAGKSSSPTALGITIEEATAPRKKRWPPWRRS